MNLEQLTQKQIENLGKRIRGLRKAQGFTNAEIFAYEHGISRSQYARYERGEDLRFSTLIKLLTAFGISLNEFFNEGFD